MATIYDVARAAGVSTKTVSRVLNGDGPVGEATRGAVEAAMRDLAYVPSTAARSMRSSRSRLVGVITGAISFGPDPGQAAGLPEILIVKGIQAALARAGMTMMIADTGGQPEPAGRLIRSFLQHRAEGLIYVADHHQQVDLPAVPPETPLVLANCFDTRGTPAILPDDRRGAEALTARLILGGHRRIGYLAPRVSLTASQLRIQGWRDAHVRAGIAIDPALAEPCDFDLGGAGQQILWDAIDRMLALPVPPTVLMCSNDHMATCVYGILRSRGVRVPQDMSVAGYDNHRAIAETLFPALTTAELPYAAMGARAADTLLALIRGDAAPPAMLVSGPVVWRASVTETTTTIHQLNNRQGGMTT
jgi:LacI family transcriptional regulator